MKSIAVRRSFKMRKLLLGLVLYTIFGLGSARADVTYTYSGEVASAAGGIASANLYLNELVTGASYSLIFQQGGVFGAGVKVTRVSGDATFAGNFEIKPNLAAPPAGFGNPPTALSLLPATATQTASNTG